MPTCVKYAPHHTRRPGAIAVRAAATIRWVEHKRRMAVPDAGQTGPKAEELVFIFAKFNSLRLILGLRLYVESLLAYLLNGKQLS
ncbi:predicted protein [Sclerotinia sclerotiorum 1980 UF-70]|uniref:Uncharacterized protein n=1 Tax=Sclerotinia sclerotiorum (strain ATCC 18683 / 1980 / Ss-1) TaxID=665079 RepID=A7E9T3_SCLS1|nr:predicted protein [Sclerotinia sclerotiorum 1980 UF-70]EDN97135.1 predicted protein [Sclerotinia sclerotiorum 1980 UF-70]